MEIPTDPFGFESESKTRFDGGLVECHCVVLDPDEVEVIEQKREDEIHGVRVDVGFVIPRMDVDETEQHILHISADCVPSLLIGRPRPDRQRWS